MCLEPCTGYSSHTGAYHCWNPVHTLRILYLYLCFHLYGLFVSCNTRLVFVSRYLVINSSAAGGYHWRHPVSLLWIVLALVFALNLCHIFASHICVLHFYLYPIFVRVLYLYQVQSLSRRRSLLASCITIVNCTGRIFALNLCHIFASHICVLHFYLHPIFVCMLYL